MNPSTCSRGSFSYHPLENTGIGLSWSWGSGFPYSPHTEGEVPEINTERQPFTMSTDLTLSRVFPLGQANVLLNLTVFNLFNRRNIESVFDPLLYEQTGRAGGQMGNPSAYSSARHAFLSAGVEW
ncbi:hypothetical protein CSA37_01620 [Candidatus Fermentibacteria bacterium]|nr:MAG: hypothetical protein CSA37_13510 [Candidatus Fermentibacteria bacterium]PIE53382.1 MAG: hypothetical protein CSA37_01620 [Candidatus Fermentibacteria bacterium]